METADAAMVHLAYHPEAGDELLLVTFRKHPVMNKLKSWGGSIFDGKGMETKVEGAGRPIFDDVEYVEIRIPGDKIQITDRPVTNRDRQRFRERYQAFKAGQATPSIGTPLTEWPGCTRGQAEEMKHFGIHTVEQLAGMPDGNASNVGPIMSIKQKAKDYLEAAKGFAPTAQLRAELAARDEAIEGLKRQMAKFIEDQNDASRIQAIEAKRVEASEPLPSARRKRSTKEEHQPA